MEQKRIIGFSQNTISTLFSGLNSPIVQTQLDGTIIGWFGQCTEFFGYKNDEIIGKSVLKLFPDNDLNNIHESVLLWFDTNETFEIKVRCLSKSKETFYALLKCSRINVENEITILYSFIQEFESLSNSRLINFKELLNNAPIPVQILDREGFNLWYNKEFLDFYTLPPAKEYSFFRTKLFEKLGLGSYIEKALQGEIAKVPPTWVNLFQVDEHAPIMEYCLESVFYPIKDEVGEVLFLVIFESIVTERALAEKLIKENQKKNSLLIDYTTWILSLLDTSKENPLDVLLQNIQDVILKIQQTLVDFEFEERNFQENSIVLSDDIKNSILKINGSSILTFLKIGELYPQLVYPTQLSELTGFNSSVISKKIKILLENNLIEEKIDSKQFNDNRKRPYGITKNGLLFFLYLRDILQNTALLTDRKELEDEIKKNLRAISFLEEKRTQKMVGSK